MDNDVLKTYEILGKIGEGSGGTIYKAYHKRLGKMVVLKRLINPKSSMQANRREVNILKNLNNTYLPQVLDFLETDAGIFTVMSFVPGQSFQQLLREKQTFEKERLLKWAKQMCIAMDYLHRQDKPIIHGDIKPSNIMLTPQDNICIIDFNISTFLDERTVYGCTKGYASPEQFWAVSSRRKNEEPSYVMDETTDIYSAGATLYHIATGNVREDYQRSLDMELLTQRVGPDFAAVIQKAMSLDPTKRFQSAAEMYHALAAIPEAGEQRLIVERKKKRNVLAITAAAAAAVALIGGGIFAFSHHQMNVYADLVQQQQDAVQNCDYDKETDCYEKAVKKKPHQAGAYYWHAYADYSCGDYEGCISKCDEGLDQVPEKSSTAEGRSDLWALEGASYLANGNNEDAVDAFENATEYTPSLDAAVERQYAVALARTGRYDEAESALDRADSEDGKNGPQSENTRAEIEKARGNYGEAEEHFGNCIHSLKDANRSMDEEELLCNAYMSEAEMLKERNEGKAKTLLREADRTLNVGGRIIANRKLASWSYDSADYSEAINCYEKIIETNRARADDYERLGESAAGRNSRDDVARVDQVAEQRKTVMDGKADFYYYRLKALSVAMSIGHHFTDNAAPFYDYFNMADDLHRKNPKTDAAFNDLEGVKYDLESNGYYEY